ncbi:MAG: hypothetical protein JNG84_01420 [Archangium sp.]|nr:hypothetical protein [Archangium sp.]
MAVFALLLSTSAFAQVTLNPSGGTGAGTGIRIGVGPTGQIQVVRNGTGQFYPQSGVPGSTTVDSLDNGVYLAIGTTVFGPQHFAAAAGPGITASEFTPISNTVTLQPNGSGVATTVLRAVVSGRNYDVTVKYTYAFPNDFVTVEKTVVVPSGHPTTLPVRLYQGFDAYLGTSDFGPSFFNAGPPRIVGGYREQTNIVVAWRYRAETPWTAYFGGYYRCLFDQASSSCPAGQNNSILSAVTFTNFIEPTSLDNSFAVMWNFGSTPGTFKTANDLTFFSYQPTLSKAFGSTFIQAGGSTALTFTIDNVPGAPSQGTLSFTDTFPSGLTLANASVSNTCNGTVTNGGGGALAAGATSVRLTNGTMAPLTTRCTLTVNVTSTTPGAVVNGRTNISNTSVLENQVSDQTLSVVQGIPIVTVNTPGIINFGNRLTYPVSGTCQDASGVVAVSVGSRNTSTTCASGTFSTSINVSTLTDAASVVVAAAQTNAIGTGVEIKYTSKDTVAPAAPALGVPADGAYVTSSTPTVNGTAEANSTVRAYSGSTQICTAVTATNGTWSCTSAMLPDGPVTLTATATDPAGNASGASTARVFTVDTTAPAAPAITSPSAGASVGINPSISGTAEANATVTVTETSTQLCQTTANGTGQWSCSTALGVGAHAITATQRDVASNLGPASAARTFTVANVPSVTLASPGPVHTGNVTSYPISGTCTAAAGTVSVSVGSVTGSTTCPAGTFSTTLNVTAVADGASVSLTASQTNGSGTGTDTRTVLKDTVAPPVPAISAPVEGSFTNASAPTIAGTATAGTTVRVLRSATTLCTALVPASGLWSCVSSTLTDGAVSIVAAATDVATNSSANSAARSFTVRTIGPAQGPVIVTPADNATAPAAPTLSGTAEAFATVSISEGAALVCTVTADASGAWSCPTSLGTGTRPLSAAQRDRAGNTSPTAGPHTLIIVAPPQVRLGALSPITGASAPAYTVSGTCSEGSAVSISVATVTGSAPCANGAFTQQLDVRAVPDGVSVQVTISQTNVSGGSTDTVTVVKDTVAPAAPGISTPAEGSFTNQANPTLGGVAEAGSTVRVTSGTSTLCSAVTPASGMWTCSSTTLGDGTFTVVANTTDALGNASSLSLPRQFTVDTVAPAAPVISAPAVNAHTGLSPMISGTSEPLALVQVFSGNALVCQVNADATGAWICPSTLGAGAQSIAARQTDRAGNTSPSSSLVAFTVDNVPTVFVNTPGAINRANVAMYRVTGFCTTAASTVTFGVGGVSGTTACTSGTFAGTLDATAVPDGAMVTVSASQTTAGGAGSDSKLALKDTVAPDAPTVASGATLSGGRITFGGTAEPSSTVSVFIDGRLVGTAQADASGAWSFTLPIPLAAGSYTTTSTATDAAGNTSPLSGGQKLDVDGSAPLAPIIVTPVEGATVDRDRPLGIFGTAEPGATLRIFIDGTEIGVVTVGADGQWLLTVPADSLEAGTRVITAVATDSAGNASQRSANRLITVRQVDSRFAGQGVIGCTSAPLGLGWVWVVALGLSRRRRAG